MTILFHPFFCFLIACLMWTFHRWPHHPVVIVLTILLTVFGIFNFFGAFWVSWRNALMFGPELLRLNKQLRKYRRISDSPLIWLDRIFGYSGMLILALGILIETRWLGIAVALVGITAFNFTRFAQPPFALVLGASGRPSRNVARDVTIASLPFQTTNFLRLEKNRNILDAMAKGTSRRLGTDAASWTKAVDEMAQATKIIVVDVRELPQTLRDELTILDQTNVWFKTILVSADGLVDLRATEGLESETIKQSLFVTEKAVLPLVLRLKKSAKLLPTIHKPIATLEMDV